MKHAPLELWLPPLERLDPAGALRKTLAQSTRLPAVPGDHLAAVARCFSLDAATLPAAALIRQRLAGDATDGLWLSADPCWVQPDLTGVRLLAWGALGLDQTAADALAEPLRPLFEDAGMQLHVSSPDHWQLRLPQDAEVPAFASPEHALGDDLFQHLPQSRGWRQRLNEVQMLLHQHPLNTQRRQRGQPPVNSLWLWGGGRLPDSITTALRGVVTEDLLLQALAQRAGLDPQLRTSQSIADAGAGWLVDLADVPPDRLEGALWPMLVQQLRRQSVTVQLASGERWRHRPWHRWRRWRKALP